MADAEDLKSSGDFSSCGFDSHPGHHFFLPVFNRFTGSLVARSRRVTCAYTKNHLFNSFRQRASAHKPWQHSAVLQIRLDQECGDRGSGAIDDS